MSEPVWTIEPAHPELNQVAERLGLHPGATQVLLNRGGLAAATTDHLAPRLAQLADPSALRDVDVAVELLVQAILAQTPICIYGDYDVDGTSASAVLVENLKALSAVVGYYTPHRLLQGYGLHKEAVDEVHARGFRVLVTADLGISNAEEVAYAKGLGLQVIVVDHHQVPERLPIADAVINPHRPDDGFPYKPLCAAGVAFHLLIALRRRLRAPDLAGRFPELDLRRSLDLVALATVADMVPLTGVNRILVARGLDVIRTGSRPGLLALMRAAGLEPGQADAQALGFRLGPRVNAAGRMGSAMRCVELFLSDGLVATDLAARLDQENASRRSVEDFVLRGATAQAEGQAAAGSAGICVAHDDWHPGVVGIVASRLVERFHRPVLVIGQGGKGSGRSVPSVNLLNVLRVCADAFLKFGGHPYACGVTLKPGADAALRSAFAKAVTEASADGPYRPTLAIDHTLAAHEIDDALVRDLDRVGPYGVGHPEPMFHLKGALITGRRQVGDGHLKLVIDAGAGRAPLSAIAFRQAAHPAASADFLDLAFTPFVSHFSGTPKVELRVKALRPA
ncbi:MAG: single-stranded-DNA-specific exonuclease RecJ [Deltaproteobacteria bacterium]|nr:single-stranded-DNA-specific exonuclease RecJ [Deltaproteobacteria bacterium]